MTLLAGGLAVGGVVAPATASVLQQGTGETTTVETTTTAGAKVPVYRDPPSYKGVKKTPTTTGTTAVPPVPLTTAGTHPRVYVDEAGTAHIVWNEDRGAAADVTVYCRLPRAATACASRSELTWEKTYGAGDGPQYNIDNIGPHVVRIGEQLMVLSFRYPTIGQKPDGASSNTLVGWVSNDGGSSWGTAQVLGKRRVDTAAVGGAPDSPTVVTIGQDPFCGPAGGAGSMCVTQIKSGQYSATEGILSPVGGADYYASAGSFGGTVTMALGDGGVGPADDWQIWVRQWNGQGNATDPGQWSVSAPIAGDEPNVAVGPAGIYLMHRGWNGAYTQDLVVRPIGPNLGAGAPVTISADGRDGVLAQDASGGLHAVWRDAGGVTIGSGGPSLTARQVVETSPSAGQLDIAAAGDGGGFATLNQTGGVTAEGPLVAQGFGSQAPNGQTGVSGLPGGGNVTCQAVGFGSFEIKTVSGCLLPGTGKDKNFVVSYGTITLNGLEIVPLPGSRIVIDPAKLTLDTLGPVKVLLQQGAASVELFAGELHRDLSKVKPGSSLFDFPNNLDPTQVLGFPIASAIPVQLTATGVRIPVELRLPKPIDVVTAKAVLIGETGKGLVLDSLDVHVGTVPLGALTIDYIDVHWQQGGTWRGAGKVTLLVGGSLEAQVTFVAGDFESASMTYTPNPPITIGPAVYLTSIGGGLQLRPNVRIDASASIGAGAPVAGAQPITASGTFTMIFPPSGPATFRLAGNVKVVGITVGEGFVQFRTDGYAQLGGKSELEIGPLSGGVGVSGFVQAQTGRFSLDIGAGASICYTLEDPSGLLPPAQDCDVVGVGAVISSIGLAACAGDDDGLVSAGLALRWDEVEPALLLSPVLLTIQIIKAISIPCNTSDYSIPPPADVAALGPAAADLPKGTSAYDVPKGLPSVTFLVQGDGALPDAGLVGPGGEVLVGPGASGQGVRVVSFPDANAKFIVVAKPGSGAYAVTPGTVPIAETLISHGIKPAKVKAKLLKGKKGKKGRKKQTIRYRAKGLTAGQQITFRERGAFGVRDLKTVTRKKGRITFRPAKARPGKRVVEAVLLVRGLPATTKRIGSFKVPKPPKPKAAKKIKVKRQGSTLVVRLKPGKGSAYTLVSVKGSTGARTALVVKRTQRTLRLPGYRWDKSVKVSAQSWSRDGVRGKSKKVKVRLKRR